MALANWLRAELKATPGGTPLAAADSVANTPGVSPANTPGVSPTNTPGVSPANTPGVALANSPILRADAPSFSYVPPSTLGGSGGGEGDEGGVDEEGESGGDLAIADAGYTRGVARVSPIQMTSKRLPDLRSRSVILFGNIVGDIVTHSPPSLRWYNYQITPLHPPPR